jgi:hypothetical protein
MQLGYLVANMLQVPAVGPLPASAMQWLGKAHALVSATGDMNDSARLKSAIDSLRDHPRARENAVDQIIIILYRALAVAELRAPSVAQGAFIPAGNTFDAMAAVGKVLGAATNSVLIVDPYMDEKALTDFIVLAPEKVAIQLFADQASHKPSLKPAVERWTSQHGAARSIEARLAPPRALHDRLIAVDGAGAWVLTQSLKDFAARSPATIVRVDPETAALKIAAYEGMWQAAVPL